MTLRHVFIANVARRKPGATACRTLSANTSRSARPPQGQVVVRQIFTRIDAARSASGFAGFAIRLARLSYFAATFQTHQARTRRRARSMPLRECRVEDTRRVAQRSISGRLTARAAFDFRTVPLDRSLVWALFSCVATHCVAPGGTAGHRNTVHLFRILVRPRESI
jgi:hypothetical protein